MNIKHNFWKQKWTLPGIKWSITGYSRAAYRTGFYIRELDMMLDAGPQCFSKPSHIMITHTHGDHITNLPFTMIGPEEGTHMFHIYAPAESEKYLRGYITSLFETNLSIDMNGAPDQWYKFYPMMSNTNFEIIANNNPYKIEVFTCDHSVPTVSYGISTIKQKLKDEYKGIPGKELAQLRKSGTEITAKVTTPILAYLCDTNFKALEVNPTLFNYKIIITECTFLYQEHIQRSEKTKHIHWNDIKPYIESHPEITFVLIHFSLQYTDKEIYEFFKQVNLPNIKVWNSYEYDKCDNEDNLNVPHCDNKSENTNMIDRRKDFWRQKWTIPELKWNITGYSRAAYRTGFYIQDLDLMLDAGPDCCFNPSHIMITHTHGDHIAHLPLTLIDVKDRDCLLNIYAPDASKKKLMQYINSLFEANNCDDIEIIEDKWYKFNSMIPGTSFETNLNNNPYQIEVFYCDHSVPTVSYGISTIRYKLKKDYMGLPGNDIAALRKSGTEITEKIISPNLAYLCDTSYKALKLNPTLFDYKIIIVECTFLYAEHLQNASDTKHIHWDELKPYIEANPNITFMLIHFSMQYRDSEINEFFKNVSFPNIKVWNSYEYDNGILE